MAKGKRKLRGVCLYSKLLKRKVRLPFCLHDPEHKVGVIVNVYLIPAGVRYTIMLRDGRLVERTGQEIVIEK